MKPPFARPEDPRTPEVLLMELYYAHGRDKQLALNTEIRAHISEAAKRKDVSTVRRFLDPVWDRLDSTRIAALFSAACQHEHLPELAVVIALARVPARRRLQALHVSPVQCALALGLRPPT